MKIISYYTPEYKPIAEEYLIPSLDKLNLDYYIYEVENRGSWIKNVQIKPEIILKAFNDFPDESIYLYVDVDAKVFQYPFILHFIAKEYDIGVFYLDHNEWYHNGSQFKELCSGTIYIPNKQETIKLLIRWNNYCHTLNQNDQKCLDKAIKDEGSNAFELPIHLCYINTLPDGREPFIKIDNPFIVHYQKSREMKRNIK